MAQWEPEPLVNLCARFPGRMTMNAGDKAGVTLKVRKEDDVLRAASRVVEVYEEILAGE